jgi:hypothetical protein
MEVRIHWQHPPKQRAMPLPSSLETHLDTIATVRTTLTDASSFPIYLNAPVNFSSFKSTSIAVMIFTPGFALQYKIISCSNTFARVTWM